MVVGLGSNQTFAVLSLSGSNGPKAPVHAVSANVRFVALALENLTDSFRLQSRS